MKMSKHWTSPHPYGPRYLQSKIEKVVYTQYVPTLNTNDWVKC